ncbi:MAG TPA: pitrilysin family protein, partial [Holophagaceae bacterium]|nr:pitrilysin family protein [Holophagaceae bacterium]
MRVLTALVLGTAILAPAPGWAAGPAGAALPAPVASVEGITEYHLANGLRVLLFPDATKPNVTVNVTYLVGSRCEDYGETGMAHLLEHLQFKGTDRHTAIPKLLQGMGARYNASTWFDRTNYFETFPATEENLRAALDLEADRMVHSHISRQDLDSEMTVVRNEFESGENSPIRVTLQRIQAVAFDWHNYGKDTIGDRSDIEHVNIQHLQAFYRKYYQPDNAVLLVAGKFDPAATLKEIVAEFGAIPRPARELERTWTTEPTQDGERQVVVRRVGGTPFVGVGYHIPASSHPDRTAFDMLGLVLTSAPSGRLYKALVETKLAAQVGVQSVDSLEPGYAIFAAILPKDGDVEKAKAAMIGVLEDLAKHPITQEETDRARAQLMTQIDKATSDTSSLGLALSEYMAAGDWRLFFLQRDRIQAMKPEDLTRAAAEYLKASNRTEGEYVPTEHPDRAEIPATPDVAAMVKDYKGRALVAQGEAFDPSPANIEKRTERFKAANGLQGALLPKRTKGERVSATLTLRFGSEQTLKDQGAVPDLVADMLQRGTTTLTRQQIQDRLDQLKATMRVFGGPDSVTVVLDATRQTLPETLKLAQDVLQHPSFPEQEFKLLVDEQVTGLEQQKNEPTAKAVERLRSLTDPYPAGHPLHSDTAEESEADLKAATLDQLKAFHAAFYGAQAATFAAVGDFDAPAIRKEVESLFGGWTARTPFARIPRLAEKAAPADVAVETPDKANAFFVASEAVAMKDSDADYPAMVVANFILGGSTLKSRIGDRLRQKEGFSYGAGSQFAAPSLDPAGSWAAYAIYNPGVADKLEAAFKEELARALKSGFTADELTFAKQALLQSREVGRTSDPGLAGKLSGDLFLDRTMAYDADLDAKLQALTLDQVNAALRAHLD